MVDLVANMLQRARFLLRVVLFGVSLCFLALLNIAHGLILLLLTWKAKHMNNVAAWGRVLARFMSFTGTEVVLDGREHLEADRSCIFVSNHQSSLDLLAMLAIWPRNTVAVAKQSIILAPIFGQAVYLNGTILINRKDGAGARQQLNSAFKEMVPRKERIWFFPEGTRNRSSNDMLPFKKGAFYMAIENQVPIVPIVFSSMSDFYSRSDMRWDSGSIRLRALPAVPTAGLSRDDLSELMRTVSNQMLDTLAELNGN